MNKDNVLAFLKETDEGQRLLQSRLDKHFDSSLETWKRNNLQKEIDQHDLAKRDLHEVNIEELQKQVDSQKKRRALKSMCLEGNYSSFIPVDEVVELLVNLPEDEGAKTLVELKDHVQKIVNDLTNTEIDSRLKELNMTPMGFNHNERQFSTTKEDLLNMDYNDRVKFYQSNPEDFNKIMNE